MTEVPLTITLTDADGFLLGMFERSVYVDQHCVGIKADIALEGSLTRPYNPASPAPHPQRQGPLASAKAQVPRRPYDWEIDGL
jgi:hypothetical protein